MQFASDRDWWAYRVRHPARSFDISFVEFRIVVHRTENIYRSGFSCFVRQRCCVGHAVARHVGGD